jgi:hypothetical protein
MKYKLFDMNGKLKSEDKDFPAEGELHFGQNLGHAIPTHGSISVEVAPNQWFSVTTSEWSFAYFHDKPVTQED